MLEIFKKNAEIQDVLNFWPPAADTNETDKLFWQFHSTT